VTAVLRSPTWRRLKPLAILIVVAAAVPFAIQATGIASKRDFTHEKRSLDGRRELNLRWERSYQYEAAFEKCEIQSIDQVASTLHVPATPDTVGRAYARHHAPAIRGAIYHGCRDAYLGRWNPPKD
jgi:hypothetical protein